MSYNTKSWHWVIMMLLTLIWGSSFILMKRGLDAFSSSQVAALRILISSIVLAPLVFKYGKQAPLKHWKKYLLAGILGNFIPAFLFTKAETGISSSLAGILNSLTSLFTLITGVILFKNKTKLINVIGIIIGFTGAAGLLTAGKSTDFNANIYYAFYVIIATIGYALSVNIYKAYLNEVNSIAATSRVFIMLGPPAGIYLFTTDFTERLTTNPLALQSLGYIAILAIFGSAVSTIIYYWLIQKTTALFASSVSYLMPIVAILWGVFDGEQMKPVHFAWILLILIGVYLVNKK